MRTKQDTSKWDDIGPYLTEDGMNRLGIGDIMRFNKNGRIEEWKVMRMNKKKGKCYVQQVRTYTMEEAKAMLKARQE